MSWARRVSAVMVVIAVPAIAIAAAPLHARLHAQRGAASESGAPLARADAAYAAGNRIEAERLYAAVLDADPAQSRAVFRLAQLREARDRAAAIVLYRRYVARERRDPWGHMALGDALGRAGYVDEALKRYEDAAAIAPTEADVYLGRARLQMRAGRYRAAEASLRHVARTPDGARELARARQIVAGSIEPMARGTRDSDGTTTVRTGIAIATPAIGRGRVIVDVGARRAGDGMTSRGGVDAALGFTARPLAQLRIDAAAGVHRVDRTFIDTGAVTGSPGRGVGRPTVGAPSTSEAFPVGRARVVWRVPGNAIAIDARASRQVLDASPFLAVQGVLRDEIGAEADVRIAGPVRVRAFARVGVMHNADERNSRTLVGGALAFVPSTFEVTLRAQELSYGGQTALAYFAPRYVRMGEVTAYTEREFGNATLAVDVGAGAQQVAGWDGAIRDWSPAVRLWGQAIAPIAARVSLGLEVEAYDATVGTTAVTTALAEERWRYGSASISLRVAY